MYVDLNAILNELENVFNVKESNNEELKNRYAISTLCECSIKYKNEDYNILVGIKRDFPLSAPCVFWKDYKNCFFPHIEELDGKICYVEDDLYVFDDENVEGIISSCIDMAVLQIYNGKNSLNFNDFLNEFESYWRRVDLIVGVDSYIKLDTNIKMVKSYIDDKMFLIYENESDLEYSLQQHNKTKKEDAIQSAIYIPLENNINILPPRYKKMLSIAEIRNIISRNLSRNNLKKLNLLLKSNKHTKNVLISFPRPQGERVVIGISCYDFYKFIKGKSLHPLITGFMQCKITMLDVNRKDKDYLLNRGGAVTSILEKKILVLGSGSLGSHIIEQLINIGISDITIVDKDKFSIENVYRHVLGYDSLKAEGSYKAEEMKNYLEKKYRNLKLNAVAYDLVDCIEDETIKLECFDLIIVAIGNPNIEFYLNKKIQVLPKKVPTIFAWNEPYGIGGHVLVTNNAKKGGCYECLYTDFKTGEKVLKNRASLVEGSVDYAKKQDGCGSAYIPYSYLDSTQTAILCSRMVLEIFNDNEKGNPLKTWKGKNFYNIKTTKRYDLTESEMEEGKYLYLNPKCKICKEVESDN